MHTRLQYLDSLYNVCKELRDQLELELSIAKRKRTSALEKDGHDLIVLANKILSFYEEDVEKDEST